MNNNNELYFPKTNFPINIYSMKQPDLYLYGGYEPQASILCELWLGLWRHFYGFKIV